MFGHPICTGDTAAKILWLKNHEPGVYEKTYKFLTGSSYLTAKLTGKYVIDQFLAKGSFRPLYNRDGTINKENCSLYCRPDQIAECAYSFEIAGTVTEEAAKESGLKKGTPVIVGTGDSTAEAISVGLVESGTVFFQYGLSVHFFQLPGSDLQYLPCRTFILFPVRFADVLPAENQVGYCGKYFLNHAYDVILSDHGFKIFGYKVRNIFLGFS